MLFEYIDADHNGTLSIDELIRVIRVLIYVSNQKGSNE